MLHAFVRVRITSCVFYYCLKIRRGNRKNCVLFFWMDPKIWLRQLLYLSYWFKRIMQWSTSINLLIATVKTTTLYFCSAEPRALLNRDVLWNLGNRLPRCLVSVVSLWAPWEAFRWRYIICYVMYISVCYVYTLCTIVRHVSILNQLLFRCPFSNSKPYKHECSLELIIFRWYVFI